MNILYLCNEYPPLAHGGIGTFVQTVSRGLVRQGHRVSVLGLNRARELTIEQDEGVRVYRLPGRYGGGGDQFGNHLRLLRLIRSIHREAPLDLLEGNELSFAMFPGRLPGRQVIRMHGGHTFFSATLGMKPRPWLSLFERLSFARAEHLCAVSYFAAETTRRLLHLGDRPIEILPNPVDTELFRPYSDVPEQDGLIVFTGGLREKKGVRQLLQAMPQVIRAYPQAHLWLYGKDTLDRANGKSFLAQLQCELPSEIQEKVKFWGAVPHENLPQINAQASVLVYPSWMETQGIVVIEGMASARAVVASQTGPGPELIEDGVDGLLCNPLEADSIAEKLLSLLSNPALRAQLASNARAKAERRFSTQVLFEKNLAFYQRCLA